MRSAVLPVPSRRPTAPGLPHHLPRGGQDPHRLRAQGPARGGPKMDARTPPPQGSAPRDQPLEPGPPSRSRAAPAPPAGATLTIGPILAQTVHHYFPDLNAWINQIPRPPV